MMFACRSCPYRGRPASRRWRRPGQDQRLRDPAPAPAGHRAEEPPRGTRLCLGHDGGTAARPAPDDATTTPRLKATRIMW